MPTSNQLVSSSAQWNQPPAVATNANKPEIIAVAERNKALIAQLSDAIDGLGGRLSMFRTNHPTKADEVSGWSTTTDFGGVLGEQTRMLEDILSRVAYLQATLEI